ncbi:hypothetical protein J4Q44_G00302100 [Coregonus suidteri]|uniref:Uncharacterized protein n=1 Tax=Coregonus suidteri TaxID=861788 RepID=A0AAN8QBG1_9TELE
MTVQCRSYPNWNCGSSGGARSTFPPHPEEPCQTFPTHPEEPRRPIHPFLLIERICNAIPYRRVMQRWYLTLPLHYLPPLNWRR